MNIDTQKSWIGLTHSDGDQKSKFRWVDMASDRQVDVWIVTHQGFMRRKDVPSGFIKHGWLENPRSEWRFQ